MEDQVLYLKTDNGQIAYKQNLVNSDVNILFLHGLKSNMEGKKALYLHNLSKDLNVNFIRFDNYGHGNSTGVFEEQTIGSWLKGCVELVRGLNLENLIIIGSSMGAWIALLYALKQKIKSLILISPAIDFTENLIWDRLNAEQEKEMLKNGHIKYANDNCHDGYFISYNLIEEARKHLIFNKPSIDLDFPVYLLHGKKDRDVPYNISLHLAELINSPNLTLKILNSSDHAMSSDSELLILKKYLTEILEV